MRRRWLFSSILIAQFLWAVPALGQAGYKIEAIGQPATSDVPALLAAAIQPQGTRLLDGQGAALCEMWLGKAVATQQGGSGDAIYPLGVGSFVGILHFPKGGSDFRGQTIKPGYYTLRYAHIPQDGNHMGVNPYPDFVLLSPAVADTQIDQALKLEDLLKLSRQASWTPHPAVMSLVPLSQGANFPSLIQDDQGHWVLQVKLSGKSAAGGQQDLPVALVVVGQVAAT